MTELERVAQRIAKGDWTQSVRVASGEHQTVYVIDGGTMRELRAALRNLPSRCATTGSYLVDFGTKPHDHDDWTETESGPGGPVICDGCGKVKR